MPQVVSAQQMHTFELELALEQIRKSHFRSYFVLHSKMSEICLRHAGVCVCVYVFVCMCMFTDFLALNYDAKLCTKH